jgi:acyl carrier protein
VSTVQPAQPAQPAPDTETTAEIAVTAEAVLAEIAAMLGDILEEGALEEEELSRDTRLGEDLELESIDLVTLSGLLADRYGERVNLAEFLASLELEEIIALTVGRIADHVAAALHGAGEG